MVSASTKVTNFLDQMDWHTFIADKLRSPFRRRDENTRTVWGYTFQLTPSHMTPAQMEPMKQSHDVLGQRVLERLDAISCSPSAQNPSLPHTDGSELAPPPPTRDNLDTLVERPLLRRSPTSMKKRDLYALLRDHAAHDSTLNALWMEVTTPPPWVDWAQIARGQDCFYRYGGPMLTGLAFQSLLGGMGASRVVETLARTGGFSTKVARHRLYETTQLILQCTRSLAGVQPPDGTENGDGGEGFQAAIRVRLLHAAVRRRIVKLAEEKEGYFDLDQWGIPINDLDCIGTIGTFSATLIWIALPRQGIFMRKDEVADFIALWRYIAYLMGTPTDVFETPERAKVMMESLLLHELRPSETSKQLASNVIACLEAQPPGFASREFLTVNARWLNGSALCDALGLERPIWYYWILMAGQCLFFMGLCYTYRAFPTLDRRKIKALRKVFWKVIVESEYGLGEASVFEFKYVPELGKKTGREDGKGKQSGIGYRGVERRNLQAFAVTCVVVGMASYLALKILELIAVHIRWGHLV